MCLRNLCENTFSKLPIFFLYIKRTFKHVRVLAVCMKTKHLFFNKHFFFTKTEYFNTKFVSLQYKNTNRYWSKYSNKITEKSQILWNNFWRIFIFLFFLGLDLAGPTWLGRTQPASCEQWNSISLFEWIIFHLHSEMRMHSDEEGANLWRKRCWRRWRTLPVMLVAVERQSTRSPSGADSGFAGGCWPKVGSSFSLLLLCSSLLLFQTSLSSSLWLPLLLLSTKLSYLCSSFVEMLVAAAWMVVGG